MSACSALRLDRTKPHGCLAAQLIPFHALHEWNFEQCSPSAVRTATTRQVRFPEASRDSRLRLKLPYPIPTCPDTER